ncbi:putative bifunctional diguanylate cyclase/phosphodiesterase [Methyloterricola oryzae]|uniref:putative bifunctional diguanylate cyclase/phosphodiesterase n=1 Tax=Methyloterricola oryzae TaxID=1495050 RepID=UPI00069B3A4C|nr:bifunctional diguanylate cyclase/phosphodiesterase [Methyloterricola oryzae]
MIEEGARHGILVAEARAERRVWFEHALAKAGLSAVFVPERDFGPVAWECCQAPPDGVRLFLWSLEGPLPKAEQVREVVASGVTVVILRDKRCESLPTSEALLMALDEAGALMVTAPTDPAGVDILVSLALRLCPERARRAEEQTRLLDELADRRVMEARLQYLVAHDELTGLANRRSLEAALQGDRGIRTGALLYLDLDRFDLVNDLEGHGSGDRLLVEVVGVLHRMLAPEQLAARIGADEFCIFLPDADKEAAAAMAERLRRALDGFHFLPGRDNYRISASLGVALLDGRSRLQHPGEAITRAHQACNVAKSNGRNRVHCYNEDDQDVYTRHRDVLWVPILREALVENRFFLVFQPIVRVADGAVTHYEVLLRLQGRSGQVHLPCEFIPVAERMGLIHAIDLWVVENAVDCLATLPEHQAGLGFSVNLSVHAFHQSSLYSLLQSTLAARGVAPDRITFEITETAAVSSHQQTRELIAKIRALGCHFALDDFGAGFSSFDYIKKFPVDYLKIDGQFISNLLHDETDQVLVKAMIDIARKLGKRTVAEYVETNEVFQLLREFGVDYVQGYLLGRPSAQLLDLSALPLHQPPFSTVECRPERAF